MTFSPSPSLSPDDYPVEISVIETQRRLAEAPEQTWLIDVREPHEREICQIAAARPIPMQEIPLQLGTLPKDRQLLIHCHHGGRSMRVTEFLRSRGYIATNVAGGIDAWAIEIDPKMARY